MTDLHSRIDGPEDAPWLVLSNSLGTSLEMWDDILPHLTRRFRVLRYDTRGHGRSAAPDGPYSLGDLVGDALSVMDAHGVEQAGFMGLSMGGMTGLGLALEHPARVSTVICADARGDAPQGFRDMWDERIAKVEEGGLEAIADGSLASWLTEDYRQAHPDRVSALRGMVLANDPQGYIACCRALQGLDYTHRLGDATVPLHFVGGDSDKGAPPGVMQEMADIAGGAYEMIPDAAHIACIDNPEGFVAAIAPALGLTVR